VAKNQATRTEQESLDTSWTYETSLSSYPQSSGFDPDVSLARISFNPDAILESLNASEQASE
jgi:hypothetical protein